MILRFAEDVCVEVNYCGERVDCRMLFMGDRYRQLVRLHPEAIHRFSRPGGGAAISRYLSQSAEIRQFYDIQEADGRVGLTMRDEIFGEPASFEGLQFELRVQNGARRCDYPLRLEQFTALGQMLPLLTGDRTTDEVAAALQNRLSGEELAWAESLVAHLLSDSFLEHAVRIEPNYFLRSPVRPRVTFIGHSSLLLQSHATAVLTDPLLFGRRGVQKAAFDLPRLDLGAICCSHSHWDHCDISTLLLFDKSTPIFIPKIQRPTIFNPPIASALKLIGFTDIREIDLWRPIQIEDVEFVPAPFHGEQDEPEAKIDHYTYVLRTSEISLYGGVDAFRDSFGDMRAELERVRLEYRPTVAFLPISRMTYSYRGGGVNGFCRHIDTKNLCEEFQYTAGPDLAAEWSQILDAKWIVPYATFTFGRTATSPRVAEFADQLAAIGLIERLLALRPMDSVELKDIDRGWRSEFRRIFLTAWFRTVRHINEIDRWLQTFAVYREARRVFWAVPDHLRRRRLRALRL